MSLRNRRDFLEDSLLAAAATVGGTVPLLAEEAKVSASPNEKLRGAVIGCNGRGGDHISHLIHRTDVELACICDVDSKAGNSRCEQIEKSLSGHKPKYARDLRTVLDDKSVDFVTIATPNHWHSLAAIWAMQAGKDVYVEKPVSHNVSEGRRTVQTAERHKRICLAGTQSRSSPGLQEAVAYLRAGKLGEVKLARGLNYKPRASIGPKGNYPIPQEVNYDLWSGPAPIRPLTRRRFHYDWHWQWDYGNGDLGNGAIHFMDIARWGLGINTLAQKVLSYGGRFGYEDAGETPNTQVTVLEFGPEKTLVLEVRGLKTDRLLGDRVGVIFYGAEGYMVVSGYTIASVFDLQGKLVKTFGQGGDRPGNSIRDVRPEMSQGDFQQLSVDHFDNFIRAVRSRDSAGLNAPILEGHVSSALCHLGNISYRLGSLHSNAEALDRLKSLKGNDHAQETLDRVVSHLAENGVKLDGKNEFRLGQTLAFDPANETFVGSSAADALLTRDYRAPYIVPAADRV